MPPVDATALAEQARTLAADLRATYNAGEVKAQRAAALLDTLADALAPSSAPTGPHPFKVGDRVRIARKFEGSVEDWWWIAAMDYTLGRVGTILNTPKDATASMYVVGFEDDALGWVYPFGSLDLLPTEDGQ